MLGVVLKYFFLMIFVFAVTCGAAHAQLDKNAPPPGPSQAAAPPKKPIVKVKPAPPPILKVKPSYGFGPISRFNPLSWGPECFLPMPHKGQVVISPSVTFARIQGEINKPGTILYGLNPNSINFDDQLGLPKSGNAMWSVMAQYQLTPRVAVRYAFSPISMEASHRTDTSFTFQNRSFVAGSTVHSKWERFEHRAGLSFSVSRSDNSDTSVFAEWLYIQDKITIGDAYSGALAPAVWDTDKNLAILGLELNKCLKNFGGNTLALSCKGGVAFLDDHTGYEAEAALSYLLQIRPGRYGFIKGGYRYASLKKDRNYELFKTTMDGAFVNVGLIF